MVKGDTIVLFEPFIDGESKLFAASNALAGSDSIVLPANGAGADIMTPAAYTPTVVVVQIEANTGSNDTLVLALIGTDSETCAGEGRSSGQITGIANLDMMAEATWPGVYAATGLSLDELSGVHLTCCAPAATPPNGSAWIVNAERVRVGEHRAARNAVRLRTTLRAGQQRHRLRHRLGP